MSSSTGRTPTAFLASLISIATSSICGATGTTTHADCAGKNVNVYHVNDTDKVFAFHRWENGGAGDDVVVIANFRNRSYYSYSVGFPRGGLWRVRFNGDWSGYSSAFTNFASYDLQTAEPGAHTMPCAGSVGLGPYTAIMLSQDS